MKHLEYTFDAIGTRWHVQLQAPDDLDKAALMQAVYQRIETYDQAYSRFRSDSLVTAMSKQAGTYTLPNDAPPLIQLYKELYIVTGGAFTPLIGNVLEEAGYDASYSLNVKDLHTPPPWDDVIRYDGNNRVEMLEPAILDFGAAGKGYLVDIIAQLLSDRGIVSYCIDAGGDILQRSADNQSLQIGLENPHDTTEAIGIVNLLNGSVCGSAGNRRKWDRFHHIINPHTLVSPPDIAAIWVVAKTALVADALATALFFTPATQLRDHYEYEYVIMYTNGGATVSSGFPGELFTA